MADTQPEAVADRPRLLLVDDEANILAALRRLLRSEGYDIVTAGSGAEGLKVLEQRDIDLIISDMRMPEMDGAQFLGHVAADWPDTIRILLTGYADMASTVQAVNEGHIYHYLTKPWNDHELLVTIRNAIEKKALRDERLRLTEALERKNQELSELNHNLEQLVRQRTARLRTTLDERDTANKALKKQFFETIKVLSRIIELRPGMQLGLSRMVAEQSKRVAMELALPEKETQNVIFAGLLFQLGRLTLPDRTIQQSFYLLNVKERERVLRSPQEGAVLLDEIEALCDVAAIIRSQYEKFDGSGVPGKLRGREIPIGARILAVVRDYNLYLEGALTGQKKIVADAQQYLTRNRESYYDPEVVDAYMRAIGRVKPLRYRPIIDALPCQLMEGMEVVDVKKGDRVYLQGGVLDKAYIDKILELRDEVGIHLQIRIRARM